MHRHAKQLAECFKLNFHNPECRVDTRIMQQQKLQAEENREVLRHIALAVEYLAKQRLPLRGYRDDSVDFSCETVNTGNFIATLQLMAKGSSLLHKHLTLASKNARYTSKTIQNEIIFMCNKRSNNKTTTSVKVTFHHHS